MASLTSELVDLDSTELDKLIHNLEFENQQCVKMIERKNQVISSLSSQMEHQMQEKKRLEDELSRFDEDTKRLHRNYINNRDNIACLKNTMSVMSDHITALSKQLSALQAKTSEESKTFNEHLTNYTKTRDEYMAKYRAFPMALTLEEAQKAVFIHQEKVNNISENKNAIAQEINEFEDELSNKVMTRIVLKIVKTKINTQCLENEIHECVREKTMLLEQLKELQKSKQQDLQETACISEINSHEAPNKNINHTTIIDDVYQGEICSNKIVHPNNEIEDEANTCIETSLMMDQREQTTVEKINENMQAMKASRKDVDLDADGDVTMKENNLSTKCYDQSSFNAAGNTDAYPESTKIPSTRSFGLPMKDIQGTDSDHNSKVNLQNGQTISSKENPGLGKPRVSIPRLPSLSRISPALRVPSLTVPRPSRVQQPRMISHAQRKILPVTAPDFPQIKQPIPLPPRLSTFSYSTSLSCVSSLKLTRPQSNIQVPSLESFHPKQVNKATDSRNVQLEQKRQYPGDTNQQRKVSEPADNLPPKDVCSEPMVFDEGREHQPIAKLEHQPIAKLKDIARIYEGEKSVTQACQIETNLTPTPMGDGGNMNEENEPLFRLDHSFGSPGSLGKSLPSQKLIDNSDQQVQHNDDGSNVTPGTKPDFISGLAGFTFNNPMSLHGDEGGKSPKQKSFFSLFNISQKSGATDDNNEPEEEDGTTSVFNLMSFATDESDNAATSKGWSGASGLLGMITTENNSTEETRDSEAFSFNFGLSKGTEEKSENQTSFFNFGASNFNTDYTEKPLFNLF